VSVYRGSRRDLGTGLETIVNGDGLLEKLRRVIQHHRIVCESHGHTGNRHRDEHSPHHLFAYEREVSNGQGQTNRCRFIDRS